MGTRARLRIASLVSVVDGAFIFIILMNDFLNFLVGLLVFVIILYLFYRLGFVVSNYLFETIFGKDAFLRMGRSKHLFAIYLVILFTAIVCGSPTEINLISIPEMFPTILISSLVAGGFLFTRLLAKEMLSQTNLPKFTGPIPGFWRRIERTGKNDDYRKSWKTIQNTPPSITRKLLIIIWTYTPALSIAFVALVLSFLLYMTLYLSLILDAILIAWLVYTLVLRFRPTLMWKNAKADTEKTLAQSLFSGYYRLGPKSIVVSLCLMSNLLAIILSAHPFIFLFLVFPSALAEMRLLEAISVVLILFTPLVSYQLYFWWLLLRRSSVFLRVWHGQCGTLDKIKTLPLWAIALFSVEWYPLIIQEFLLGHHFYPYKGELSLSFLFSLTFTDAIAVIVFALLSVTCFLGLVKLVRRKETNLIRSEIYHDNISYGLVSLALWTSTSLVLILTQAVFPISAILMLYLTFAVTYMPDLARFIKQKFAKDSWLRRIFFYGSPLAAIASFIVLAMVFSLFDMIFVLISLAVLLVLFLFFLWFDLRMTEFERKSF